MPSLLNMVIRMDAGTDCDGSVERATVGVQAMMVKDELSKDAEAYRSRQKAAVAAARERLAQEESSAMELEDQRASSWRRLNYRTPEQDLFCMD